MTPQCFRAGVDCFNMAKYLKIPDVERMGLILVDLAARFPRTMGTERQLSPAMYAMLQVHDENLAVEWNVAAGRIDFRTSGNNPSFLELAVAPRILGRGDQSNQLSPSQNKTELKKLDESSAQSRYLLLVDLEREDRDFEPSYVKWRAKTKLQNTLRVVTASRGGSVSTFSLKPT